MPLVAACEVMLPWREESRRQRSTEEVGRVQTQRSQWLEYLRGGGGEHVDIEEEDT